MKYLRLYTIAMQNINEIAEELLETVYDENRLHVKYWYTLDGKEFTHKLKAIDHQIEWLLGEENDE